jgi:hypothetical protein
MVVFAVGIPTYAMYGAEEWVGIDLGLKETAVISGGERLESAVSTG